MTTGFATVRVRLLGAALCLCAAAFGARPAHAQVRVGSGIQPVGTNVAISSGQSSISGFQGTLTDPTGTPGLNPGNTLFVYGNSLGTDTTNSGALIINSTSTGLASLKYFTNSSGALDSAIGNDVATNFNPAVGFTRQIINNAAVNSRLLIRSTDAVAVNPNTPGTFLDLSTQALLPAYNARLNQILTFDSANFLVSNGTGGTRAINATDGTFSYTLSGYENGLFRDISLTYTPVPVPEPACLLAVAAAGVGAWRLRRRRVATV